MKAMHWCVVRFLCVLFFLHPCAGEPNSQRNNYLRSLTTVEQQPSILWISHDDVVPSVLPSFITVSSGCRNEDDHPPFDSFHVIVDACFDDTKRSGHLSDHQLLINVIGTGTAVPSIDTKVRVISLIHQYQAISNSHEAATDVGLQLPSILPSSWKTFVCNALLQPDFPCQVSTWATTSATRTGSMNNIDLLASVLILANTYANRITPLVVPAVYRVRPLLSLDVSNLGLDPVRTLRFRYFNVISAFVGINMECHRNRDDEFINTHSHEDNNGKKDNAMMDESGLSLPFPAESLTSLELRMELLDHVLIQLLKDAPQYCPYMGLDGMANGEVGKAMDLENINEDQSALPSSSPAASSSAEVAAEKAAAAETAAASNWMEVIRRAEDAATNQWLFRQLRNLMDHGLTLIALIDRIDADAAGEQIKQYLLNINTGASDEHVYFSYVMYVDELVNMSRGNSGSEKGEDYYNPSLTNLTSTLTPISPNPNLTYITSPHLTDNDAEDDDIRKSNISGDTKIIKVGRKEIPWIFSLDDVSMDTNRTNFAHRNGGDRDPMLHALVIISMSTWDKIKQIADNDNDNDNHSNNNRKKHGSRESHLYGPINTDEFITITPPIVSSFVSSPSTESHEFPASDQELTSPSISPEPSELPQNDDECELRDLSESNVATNSSLPKAAPMVIRLKFVHHIQNNHHHHQCKSDQHHDTCHTSSDRQEYVGYRSFRYDVIVESTAYHRFDLVRRNINNQKTDENTQRRADRCEGNNRQNSINGDSNNEIILLTHMGKKLSKFHRSPSDILSHIPLDSYPSCLFLLVDFSFSTYPINPSFSAYPIVGDEALMLPQWISHHASMFHRAYLLDYNSADNSMEIARAFAPASWKIIPSRTVHYMFTFALFSTHLSQTLVLTHI